MKPERIEHKIEDRVICVSVPHTNRCGLVVGEEYIVSNTEYCENCGSQSVDIGHIETRTHSREILVCSCGHCVEVKGHTYTGWYLSTRFRPLDVIEAEIEEALNTEILEEVS